MGYSGEYLDPTDVRNEEAPESAEQFVDERAVEEFKNFKIDDWKYYLGNWTWWKAEVSYDFKPFIEHIQFFRYLKYILSATMLTYLFIQFSSSFHGGQYMLFERYNPVSQISEPARKGRPWS